MSLGRKHKKPPAPNFPKTLDEAVERALTELSEKDRELVRAKRKEELKQFHHGWGTGIRNGFGLWGENRELIDSLPKEERWADNVSVKIIEGVWLRLQQKANEAE